MDDQRRPRSPHNHSPPPCPAHHGNAHKKADRARIDAIGSQFNGVAPPPLPVSPPSPLLPSHQQSHPSSLFPATSTRPRGSPLRNLLYVSFLCFSTFALVKAGSSPKSNTDIRLDALFAIMDDFNYHPLLAETWKGNNPCDDKWFGLICVEGQIKYILLVSMNLTGTISPRFADLASVRVLDLSDNFLTGTIPIELAKMRLTVLDVSYNHLHGEVPPFEALVLDGNPGIATADIVRVPLQSVDKETASVVGFYFGILVLGSLLIGGAGFLFYLAKTANHPI